MECPVVDIWAMDGSLVEGRSMCTVISVPVPQRSGHSMSEDETMNPLADGSTWMAGTGVKAWVPFWLRRFVNLPALNELAGGQVVMGALPCGLSIHSRSDRSACCDERLG